MFKEIVATILLACSGSSNSFKPAPRKATYTNIAGTYNIRQELETSYLNDLSQNIQTKTLWFDADISQEDAEYFYNVPTRYNETDYYLDRMSLVVFPTNPFITVAMVLINKANQESTKTFTIGNTPGEQGVQNITNIYNNDPALAMMYFYVRKSVRFDSTSMALFNAVFTREENQYTKNYSGYYTFNTTISSIANPVNMYGTITIGQEMFYTIDNDSLGTLHYFDCQYFDYETNDYELYVLKMPFRDFNTSGQWYLTGVKMSQIEYQRWQQVGQFAYVPQVSPDSYSFNDLFFSLADTPIYFLYSIFNWQLFGANLFIAFIGLISFALVLLLFRRFL